MADCTVQIVAQEIDGPWTITTWSDGMQTFSVKRKKMNKPIHIQYPDSYGKTGIFNVAAPIVISQMGYQFLKPSIVLPVPRFLVSVLKFLRFTVHE